MKKFLIIDGFGIIFRSYYAFIARPLTNSKGENVSAIFGFFKSLFSVLNKIQPDYYVIALEGKGKCFRKDIFPEYKANRDVAPEDLKDQIEKIINLIKLGNFPSISIDTYEADDIVGSLINKINNQNINDMEVQIFSSDKDFQQLVQKNVVIIKPGKNIGDVIKYDSQAVKSKLGIEPSQVIDYLALIGDSSDNIPGVRGVGPKTATSLLKEWKTLENIYANIDNIKSKALQKKLLDSKNNAFLSQKLATINSSINLNLNWNHWEQQQINFEAIQPFLKEDGLNSIISDIKHYNSQFGFLNFQDVSKNINEKEPNNNLLNTLKYNFKVLVKFNEIKEMISHILENKKFSFDLETTGFDFIEDEIICISFAIEDTVFVVPYKLSEKQQENIGIKTDDEYRKKIIEILKELFENDIVTKIGQNLKFDLKFLKQKGIAVNGKLFDTMIAEYCIDASFNKLNMDDLAKKYFDYTTIKYKDIVKDHKKDTLLDVETDTLFNYSAQDAFITYKLYEVLSKKLEQKNKESFKLFYKIEMPLLQVLLDMEITGIHIDKEYLEKLSDYFGDRLNQLYSKLIEEAGEKFNPNSPKQLAKILFEKFKLTPIKTTKTGPSTDMEVLKKLALINPIPKLIVEYRVLKKLQSTYSDALISIINKTTNKIHTTYLQTGTQTGRLSSKNPNLQNIPIRTEEGRKIRRAFLPSKNNVLISFDYSQIELFLLAEFSRDEILYSSFQKEEDVHTKTASIIFNKSTNEITKEERSIAKTVNFGVLYGQSAFSLAEELNISRSEASNFIKVFFDNYSGVKKYIENLKIQCENKGYAETFWGRRRTIPEIREKNKLRKSYGERMAVNTTIQGSAADLIKICMVKIHNELEKQNLKSKLILQVHDELIFDVNKNEIDLITKLIKEKMEEGYPFSLKLKTSMKIGNNWGELY